MTLPIANLETSSDDVCTICFYDAGASMRCLPTKISGYFSTPVEGVRGDAILGHPRYRRAVRRGHETARRFEQLIRSVGNKRAKITVSPIGIVGGYPQSYHEWATKRIAYFVETRFDFPTFLTPASIVSSMQWLHFAGPSSKAALQDLLTSGLRNVTILSGICLFSAKAMAMATKDVPIINLESGQCNGATLYELEYIARSAPAIADIAIASQPAAEQTAHINGHKAYQPLQICLDIPSFHYYQTVDDLLRSGRCEFAEALHWLRAIEEHHQQISHVFRGYLHVELLRRDPSIKPCAISVTPGGERILTTIRKSLMMRTLPSVQNAIDDLSAHEPAWTRFMQFVPDAEKPKDFRALGQMFYVYQVVRHALGEESAQSDLLISVEDSAERGVYSRAQKLLKRIRESTCAPSPVLLETYLCPRVFVDNNAHGSELYAHDPYPASVYEKCNSDRDKPLPGSSGTPSNRDCSSSRSDVAPDKDGTLLELDSLKVIERLYGERSAALLRELGKELIPSKIPGYTLASTFVALGGILNGFDTGSVGAVTEMPSFTHTFGHLTPTMRGFTVSLIMLCGAIPATVAGYLADRFGRLRIIIVGAILCTIGCVLECAASHLSLFLVGRALMGIGQGFALTNIGVYICEIAPSRSRGKFVSLPQFGAALGVCVGYFSCYGSIHINGNMSWRLPYILQAALSMVWAAGSFFLPESPRWLILHGQRSRAMQELKKLDFEAAEAEKDVLRPTENASPEEQTWLAVFILSFVQLSGIDGVLYYAPTIFAQAGIPSQTASFLASGVSAILMLAFSIPATILADKWGRRTSAICGGVILSGTMLLIGSLYAANVVHSNGAARWIVIVSVFVFAIGYVSTWAIVGKIYASEIQPTRTRATTNSIATGGSFLANWLVAFATPIFLARSAYGAYFLFGAIALLTLVVLATCMRETRGLSLEDIQVSFAQASSRSFSVPLGLVRRRGFVT
ncbi:hypothetical protein J4E83_010945 [Alternaria metachromatica]|uniref:uncharacterized protein n=1 Tax=Alternaria metachromatica TaxID=283354 RepID=UPI0020C2A3BB|nr:uncharacterized protein J4E83_010945 [Alternaria metachromatica]KAI4604897.1 hypothetical protein J4E83_010945 [Alternaria metachromatica]